MAKKLKITQKRSTIDRKENQKRTMRALGIRKLGHSVVQEDTPVIRGMVNTVQHLVTVEEIDGEA
jgi:large subunit ribosomal protein L30